MDGVETRKYSAEADVLQGDSQTPSGFGEITERAHRHDADDSVQLPPKKKQNGRTNPTVKLNGNNLLSSDRVTRISSGTLKPKLFSDFCDLPTRQAKGSPAAKGGLRRSGLRKSKNSINDDDIGPKMDVRGLCKGIGSENAVTLLNLSARLHKSVSKNEEIPTPSLSSVAVSKRGRSRCTTQKADDAGRLAVSGQQRGRKRIYDVLMGTSDSGKRQRAHDMCNNSSDSEQSQDVVLDEAAAVCLSRNQNADVSDESEAGGETVAENEPKCAKLDNWAAEVRNEYPDNACVSSVDSNACKEVALGNEVKKDAVYTDSQACVDDVSEQTPLLTCLPLGSNDDEGSQLSDALAPGENAQSEAKRSGKQQGPRKRQKFRCPACKLRFFETKDELDVHLECHVGKPSRPDFYQCKFCPYSSSFWSRTLSHIIVHDEYKRRLAQTRLARNILGRFPCPECGRSFERKVNMQGHAKKVHFKEDHTCDQCGLTLNGVDRKTFARHQEKCRNVRIACTFCDYTTTVTANMQKHMKVHNGEGFACTACASVFPTRQRFQVHLLTHRTDRPRYGCEYCGVMFVSEDSVKKHCARMHQNVEKSIPCPQCPYAARIKVDLRKHIQTVHEKRHQCPDCPYGTNSDRAFEQHRSYHSSDRVFACPVAGCFYRGASTKQVALHGSSVHHSGGKHQCPVCKKYYKKKTHLLRHLVSHTGDRAYACLECGQSFFSHSSYYRHRRRTRHDANRDTIASIPQNITIQYLDESADGFTRDYDSAAGAKPVEEAASSVRVFYEQLLEPGEPPPGSSSSARLDVLAKTSGDSPLGESKGNGSAIAYVVEVTRTVSQIRRTTLFRNVATPVWNGVSTSVDPSMAALRMSRPWWTWRHPAAAEIVQRRHSMRWLCCPNLGMMHLNRDSLNRWYALTDS